MRQYILHTDRLSFSLWQEADLPLAAQLWGEPDVTRYICASGVFSPDDIANRLSAEIRNYRKHGVQYHPIFLRDTEDMIGCCGLRPGGEDGVYEVGCHLRKAYWHKGYASEAVSAMIAHAFADLAPPN